MPALRALFHLPESRRIVFFGIRKFSEIRFRFAPPTAIDMGERRNEAHEADGSEGTDVQTDSRTARNTERRVSDREGAYGKTEALKNESLFVARRT